MYFRCASGNEVQFLAYKYTTVLAPFAERTVLYPLNHQSRAFDTENNKKQ